MLRGRCRFRSVLLEEARRDIKIFLPLFTYRALHLRRVWAEIIVCKLAKTSVRHWSQKIYNFPIVSVQHGSTYFPRKLQTALCMRPTLVNIRHLKQQTSPAWRRQPETWDFFRDVIAHVQNVVTWRCLEDENVRTWRFTSRRKPEYFMFLFWSF